MYSGRAWLINHLYAYRSRNVHACICLYLRSPACGDRKTALEPSQYLVAWPLCTQRRCSFPTGSLMKREALKRRKKARSWPRYAMDRGCVPGTNCLAPWQLSTQNSVWFQVISFTRGWTRLNMFGYEASHTYHLWIYCFNLCVSGLQEMDGNGQKLLLTSPAVNVIM